MRLIKQIVAVVLWCVVAVGCVAEGPQPVVVEESKAVEQSASDNSDVQITTHVDPETGEEYRELIAKVTVEKANYDKLSSRRHIVYVNDILITKSALQVLDPRGKLSLPEGFRYADWDKLPGHTAFIHCKLYEKLYTVNVCSNCLGGRRDFSPKLSCDIEVDKKYLIKFY